MGTKCYLDITRECTRITNGAAATNLREYPQGAGRLHHKDIDTVIMYEASLILTLIHIKTIYPGMTETYRQSERATSADRKVQSLSIARYMAPMRRIDDWAAQSAERNVNLLPVPD